MDAQIQRMVRKQHTLSGDLFQTMTVCPELIKFFTIPDPMMPSPRKPNLSDDGFMFFSFKVFETLERSKVGVS